jgi:gliding motility-associated protein GldM
MIGMMYLVLTAMLALNVSKEAVEAFKKVDKGLTLTVANYALKNELIYKEFDRAAAENPAKAGKYRSTAYEVKQRADEVFNYLQDLKIEIINTAEGPDNAAVNGREIVIEAVQKIDQTDVPSEILIGAEYNGKAYTLKALINEYREFLISTLEGKNEAAAEALRASLNTDEGIDHKSGEKEPWETFSFQTLPLVAVVTILSKLQVDVRNAETEVLNFLYTQIDAASFKFNKIEAVVIPKTSNYVTLGSTYEAEVFIAASDTTQQPEILVGEQKLPLDESGRGTYSVRPSSIGSKTWGGVINLKAPDGTIRPYKFESAYGVGEPNVVVSPTAMNVMYMSIPNPIDVSVPGVGADKIRISVVNGTFTTEKVKNSKGVAFAGNWAVKPTAAGQNVQVVVSSIENGKTVNHGTREFRVKPLPKPEARFGGKNTGTISKASAVAQAGVFAVLPDFDFDLQWQVTSFTLLYSDRMGDIEAPSTSSSLTTQQKELLNRLARNKDLIIKNIKAKGPDGLPVDLSPVILTIE